MIESKPKCVIREDKIILLFGKKVFEIYPQTKTIFLNGDVFDVSKGTSHYTRSSMKEKNIKREKKLIGSPYHWDGKVLIVNVNPDDGRIFWLVYGKLAFKEFRAKSFWKCSYWDSEQQGKFYLQDLKEPKKIYEKFQSVSSGQQNLQRYGF